MGFLCGFGLGLEVWTRVAEERFVVSGSTRILDYLGVWFGISVPESGRVECVVVFERSGLGIVGLD